MATPGGTKKNPRLVTRKSEMLRTHSRRITFSLSKSVSSNMPRMLDGSGMCVSVIISSPKARQPNKMASCLIIISRNTFSLFKTYPLYKNSVLCPLSLQGAIVIPSRCDCPVFFNGEKAWCKGMLLSA